PIVHVVAPLDRPDLKEDADYFNAHYVFEALDILAGRVEPHFGGSPRHLDIIGLNYYGINQWEYTLPDNVLAQEDPRRVAFRDLLRSAWDRYRAPLLISETSGCGQARPGWLRYMYGEALAALQAGVDLHGLCVYPILSMFDWYSPRELREFGVWDLVDG